MALAQPILNLKGIKRFSHCGLQFRCASFLQRWTRQTHELSTLRPTLVSSDWCQTPRSRSLSPPHLLLLSFTNHKHALTATHAQTCTHTYTSYTHPPPTHRQLSALSGTQRKMDRQELSARTLGHRVGFSLRIMNRMWSINATPIRSNDNYLSTSQSS